MNILEPLPIFRIKNNNLKLFSSKCKSKKKKFIKLPYFSIKNHNNFNEIFNNVYGKTLINQKIGILNLTSKNNKTNRSNISTSPKYNLKLEINKSKLENTEKKLIVIKNYNIEIKPVTNKKFIINDFLKKFKNTISNEINSKKNINKQRKSLLVKKIPSTNLSTNNSQVFDCLPNKTKIKKNDYYNLENIFKKDHHILFIINSNRELYDNIVKERNINERVNIFNLKIYKNGKFVYLNSMILEINNSKWMIPFSIASFLMKYNENYLVKFMKELIFLLYRRKIKGFKKSFLNFNDFFNINKQIINMTWEKINYNKEIYKIREIPDSNRHIRKSLFFNNHNNNIIKKTIEDTLNSLSKDNLKQSIKKLETKEISLSETGSDLESNTNTESSIEESEVNNIKEKLKSENIKKMEIEFSSNFSKSKKCYTAIIKYPLAFFYLKRSCNEDDKKIIRISNKEVNDIYYNNIDHIKHLIDRFVNKNN